MTDKSFRSNLRKTLLIISMCHANVRIYYFYQFYIIVNYISLGFGPMDRFEGRGAGDLQFYILTFYRLND